MSSSSSRFTLHEGVILATISMIILGKSSSSLLADRVNRLVTHLHAKGISMSVATGSHKRHFELKTQKHGDLFSMMHHIVMGDDPDVKNGKPAPDIFWLQLGDLSLCGYNWFVEDETEQTVSAQEYMKNVEN